MKKKKPTSRFERLPVVVLYQEDIEELASILDADSKVSFELDDIIYESIDELRDHKGEVLRQFEIRAKTTSKDRGYDDASVSFDDDCVRLSCSATQELSFWRAKEFLLEKRSWLGRIPDLLWFILSVILPILVLGVVPLFGQLLLQSAMGQFAFWIYVVIIIVGIFTWASGRFHTRRNLIFLKRQHEHAGILKRYESHIVRAVIGLVVGMVGGILGYLIRLFQD